MRAAFIGFALALTLAGCINWQAGYDNAARNQCYREPGDRDRRDCLDRADANAQEKRAERREQDRASQ